MSNKTQKSTTRGDTGAAIGKKGMVPFPNNTNGFRASALIAQR
jgi:hypothetical protein